MRLIKSESCRVYRPQCAQFFLSLRIWLLTREGFYPDAAGSWLIKKIKNSRLLMIERSHVLLCGKRPVNFDLPTAKWNLMMDETRGRLELFVCLIAVNLFCISNVNIQNFRKVRRLIYLIVASSLFDLVLDPKDKFYSGSDRTDQIVTNSLMICKQINIFC